VWHVIKTILISLMLSFLLRTGLKFEQINASHYVEVLEEGVPVAL
jgi:hypothetical protein